MGRECAIRTCENKMNAASRHLSFHRLPLSDPDRLKLWLVVLGIDLNTTERSLRRSDFRVCGEHFDASDFTICGRTKKHILKSTAVPRVGPALPTNVTPATAVDPHSPPTSAPFHHPYRPTASTPRKRTPKRPTRPSLSGRTRPWTQLNLSGLETSVSSVEGGGNDPLDISFQLPSTSTSSPGSSSASAHSDRPEGWEERKWIVNESRLMALFSSCHKCGVPLSREEKKIITHGSQIKVEWSCVNGHQDTWASCPDTSWMAEYNLLIPSAVLFTGTTYTEIAEWAKLLNLQIPQESQYYSIQSTYLIPVIDFAYKDQQRKILTRLKQEQTAGKMLDLCGDARCDSPGYCAKYSTYSFMHDVSKEIVHFELVQVTESTSSVAMESDGLKRGLNHLLYTEQLQVNLLTTDRSPSVRKIMREDYRLVTHEFDPWHLCKNLKKKLGPLANKKENRDLIPWIRSIQNHVWFASGTCGGDSEELIRRWTSMMHHICGVHRWEENGVEYRCHHHVLSAEEQRRKKWLVTNSPAYKALSSVVLDKRLLQDLKHIAHFKHTGDLEVYHSAMLKYAPKRLHFHYDTMRARIQLTILDHNTNLDRPQAVTKAGTQRFTVTFPKQTKDWVARKKYEPNTQAFRKQLVELVLERRRDTSVKFKDSGSKLQLPPMPANIAAVPRPPKAEVVARTQSRFHETD